nr:TCR/Tet family MFS transporter [uncultured Lichenicoccus sp.]
MTRALAVLYMAAFIDATSVGLIIPILPTLLRRLADGGPVVLEYGLLVAAFAAMQFLFAPVLGALSDRYGRRPILLLSLAGGTVDYLLTGFAPSLWLLFTARLIGGMTAANLAVVSAIIADLTPADERAARYGTMNAALGMGFIAGPALGGTFGQMSPVLPFLLAAGFNGLNLLLAVFLLPEPRRPSADVRPAVSLAQFNVFASLRWIGTAPKLAPLVALYAVLCLLGQIPGSLWVLYGQARYGWGPAVVGWSFAWFGLLFALAQMLLPGPMNRSLGERRTLLAGVGLDALACALMGIARHGWMPFAITPLFGAGNVGLPALQSAMSREVGEDRQGELQGSLASLNSLSGVIGPILATLGFGATRADLPGAVWFVGALGYAACMVSVAVRSGRERAAGTL